MQKPECSSCPKQQECNQAIASIPVNNIKNKIMVLSGKGGVGKSTVAASLALFLANAGFKVGLLDTDLHGPSIPKMLGLEKVELETDENSILPVKAEDNLQTLSTGFLVDAVERPLIWKGPIKHKVINQFITQTKWGTLDYLIVDCPPGTGDEPMSVIMSLGDVTGAIVVTTPQQLAISDVKKSVSFCREMNVPILGVIENMSGFICPGCEEIHEIFKSGGAEKLAGEMDIRFLGKIPIDPKIVEACDNGRLLEEIKSSNNFKNYMKVITDGLKEVA